MIPDENNRMPQSVKLDPVYDGACGRVVGWVNDNEVADLDDWPVYIRADIHSAEIERLTANQVIRNRRSI